jgi:hypothetical protein
VRAASRAHAPTPSFGSATSASTTDGSRPATPLTPPPAGGPGGAGPTITIPLRSGHTVALDAGALAGGELGAALSPAEQAELAGALGVLREAVGKWKI